MCVAGDKSKLLVMGTRQLRSMKLAQDMAIQVDGKLSMRLEVKSCLVSLSIMNSLGKNIFMERNGEKAT